MICEIKKRTFRHDVLRKASMVEGKIPAIGASPELFFSPMLAPRANNLATVSWPQNWVA